jgi:trehalose 6-phosphate phosphatase
VFLDLDGAIAEIAARPDAVGPDPLLTRIERCVTIKGRVALLTGRSLKDVDRIRAGRITGVAAVHGLVRRMPDGSVARFPASPKTLGGKALVPDFRADTTRADRRGQGLKHGTALPSGSGN